MPLYNETMVLEVLRQALKELQFEMSPTADDLRMVISKLEKLWTNAETQ